jgi:hypothetical protein
MFAIIAVSDAGQPAAAPSGVADQSSCAINRPHSAPPSEAI